jgi:hypothetical protein
MPHPPTHPPNQPATLIALNCIHEHTILRLAHHVLYHRARNSWANIKLISCSHENISDLQYKHMYVWRHNNGGNVTWLIIMHD